MTENKLNYIELINRFWKLDEEMDFTHLETRIFFKLCDINNRLLWKPTFKHANSRLVSLVGTRQKNLIIARQKLIDSDLISYEKGNTRNAGTYSLCPELISIEHTKESNKGTNGKVIKGTLNKQDINKTKLKNNILFDEIDFYPFDEFWNDYDKKVGDPKVVKKKWDKISKTDREKIKSYIPEYKKSQPDKQFRKNPSTFLNQKAWNDEIIN